MITYKDLWDKIITEDNFKIAQHASRQGKASRRDITDFESHLEENLAEVRNLVITKRFHTSEYKKKTIYEPKKRIIYMLPYNPDRIVQHALMNVLAPYLERLFIYDTYACVPGKGQMKASLRTMEAVRYYKYCLKCDIHKFYPSINQNILSNMYHRRFKDDNFLYLIDDIIFSFPGGYNCPIGNYTSQWNGNYYLTPLDMKCIHELKPGMYIRYCDDFLLFDNDKKFLHYCRENIGEFLENKLDLTYSRSDVFDVKQGVDFCGYRHFNNYILLRKKTAIKQQKHIKELYENFNNGLITVDELRSSVESIKGWMKHANCYNLQKSMNLDEIRKVYA